MAKVIPITEAPLPARILSPQELADRQALRTPIIDRYGELERRHELAKPDEEERHILSDQIQSWHKDDFSDTGVVETGFLYQIHLSAKRKERTVFNCRKAFDFLRGILGLRGVIAAINIPLGLIDKHAPKSEQLAFVSEERSGYRTLDVVPLHEVKNPAEAA